MKISTLDLVLRIVLVVAVVGLGFWLYRIIKDPIEAQNRAEKRKGIVIQRLKQVREAQFAYKDIHGKYADNWDSLMNTVKNGKFTLVKTIGDPNDTTIQVQRDTSYVPVADSLFANYTVDSLPYAPLTGKKFKIDADVIDQRGVSVPVFEVKDVQEITPGKTLTLGSLSEANINGNW